MTLHVVGAGLAGLSAALTAAEAGHTVVLHEAAPRAGGRCRSFDEPRLGRVLDNGAHLILGANAATFSFLERIGAADALEPLAAAFPFLDLASGRRWRVEPCGAWRLLLPGALMPGSGPADLPDLLRLAFGRGTVADRVGRSRHFTTLWEPLCAAVLNTPPDQAAAAPLAQVLRATLLAGGTPSRPHVARRGLGPALIEPALARLSALNVRLRFGTRLRSLAADALEFADGRWPLAPGDRVVLAVPAAAAAALLPGLPDLPASPIVNAHFRLDRPPALAEGPMLGLVGGVAQWLFLRDDVLTVTASAARALVALSSDEIAATLWRDAARALSLGGPVPPMRVVKERRATLLHTPPAERLRPPAATRLEAVFLAGDWTATGLPCTIEGALRSGSAAARMACR